MIRPLAILRLAHAWAGAALSLLAIVIGLSGALLVFKPDFIRLTVPQARQAVAASPTVLGAAADKIEHIHHGELRYVVFAGEGLGVHQAFFTGERYAYAAADGTMIARWTGPSRPETALYDLHHFLLAGDGGMRVVGISGLLLAALAIGGLIVWTPAWRTFSARLLPRSTRRRDLLAAHRNLGALFILPIVLFCLTGAGMIFNRTTEGWLNRLLPGPQPEEFFPPADPGDIDWPKVLGEAQALYPKATIRAAIWPAGPWAPAVIRLRQPGEWAGEGKTSVLVDPEISKVIGTIDAQTLGRGLRLNAALTPLHATVVGGRFYDVLAALSGLALALLGGFGLAAFVAGRRRG